MDLELLAGSDAPAVVGKTIQGTVRIVASRSPAPWVAQVTAETDLGSEAMEFALSPVDPDPEWDFALAGTSGGLTLMVRGRWREPEGHGEINIGWSHTVDVSRPAEQASGLALLKALHGRGRMVVEDLTGGRAPVEQELSGVHFPEELSDLQVCLRPLLSLRLELASRSRFQTRCQQRKRTIWRLSPPVSGTAGKTFASGRCRWL
jgi:hypothetical protein